MSTLYSLVLADDEQITREGLAQLPWESMGFSLDGVYSDGTSVLNWCKSHQTDVVLLDIRMPGLTGLEVAEQLHSMSPKSIVVLLSAHTEFSLAQDALRHGVYRYISKPLDLDELNETFSEVLEEVKKRDKLHQAFQQLSVAETLRSFFSQIINLKPDPLSISTVAFPKALFTVPLIFVLSDDEKPISDSLWFVTMVNGYTLSVLPESWIVNSLVLYKPTDVHYLVGKADPPTVPHQKVMEHLLRQRDRLFLESDTLILLDPDWMPGNIPDTQTQVTQRSLDLARRFQELDWQEWLQGFQGLIKLFLEVRVSKATVQWTLSLLCSQIFQILAQQGINEQILADYVTPELVFSPEVILGIQRSKKLHTCSKIILERCEPAHGLLRNMLGKRFEDRRLSKVVEFLQGNLGKPIGLDQAAEIVGMNSSAFSRWFKEVQGRNFVDFFSHMRIQHAIKLMEDPARRIGDIAQQCGYPNARYFAVVFRKHMGISPQEFRQTHS